MKTSTCAFITILLSAFGLTAPRSATAQVDLTGSWGQRFHEDAPERGAGPELGDYLGLPINDAARRRAMAWDASLLTLPEWQCRAHPADYIVRGPQSVNIWKTVDPVTLEVIAWNAQFSRVTETHREIFMDDRARPPDWALHTWGGFSTGRWLGDMLVITTTHLKESFVRRNGVPRSDRATLTEYLIRRDHDVLTWVTVINDPVYLTEPMIRTTEYEVGLNVNAGPVPCDAVIEIDRPKGLVPHILPGAADPSVEFAKNYGIPVDAARGGARTMYPEYRESLRRSPSSSATVNEPTRGAR